MVLQSKSDLKNENKEKRVWNANGKLEATGRSHKKGCLAFQPADKQTANPSIYCKNTKVRIWVENGLEQVLADPL